MKNRVSNHPGRYKFTKVSGSDDFYDVIRADDPTIPGTPFKKETMLTDETAAALGLTQEDPTVNDALNHIGTMIGDIESSLAAI